MTPEFPPWFHAPDDRLVKVGTLPSHVETTCCMMRMGEECGNSTTEGMMYPDETEEYRYKILPVCEMCFRDYNNADIRRGTYWGKP